MILTGTNQHLETMILKTKTEQPWPLGVGAGIDWERA